MSNKRRPLHANEIYFEHLEIRVSRWREKIWRVNGARVCSIKKLSDGVTLITRNQSRFTLSSAEWQQCLSLETALSPTVQAQRKKNKRRYYKNQGNNIRGLPGYDSEVYAWLNANMDRYINWSAASSSDVRLNVSRFAEDVEEALNLPFAPYELAEAMGRREGFPPLVEYTEEWKEEEEE